MAQASSARVEVVEAGQLDRISPRAYTRPANGRSVSHDAMVRGVRARAGKL
jgi:hypothetical protein